MEYQSEEELLEQVRRGDEAAFGVLFVRHRGYAYAVARRVVGDRDAEDVVAEAFERIFAILKDGRGPTTTFRPYLSVTVHNVAVNRLRGRSREQLTEPSDLIPLLVADDTSGRQLTNSVVREAFAALPARWQQVLWLCEVDRVPHDEVGELLGIKANAVAAVALRARRGLADAYLAQYAQTTESAECRKIVGHLPGYVNGNLTRARREAVDRHLQSCHACPLAILELGEARRDVSALLAPIALAIAASGTVGATGAAATSGLGAVVSGSVSKALTGVVASAAVAGAVATVALVAARAPAPHVTAAPVTPRQTEASVASGEGTPASPPPSGGPAPDATHPVATARPAPSRVAPTPVVPQRRRLERLERDPGPTASQPPTAHAPAEAPTASQPPTTPTESPTHPQTDPRLGAPVWAASPSGPAWRRVTLQVDGDGQPVRVALGGVGATSYCVGVGGTGEAGCTSRAQHVPWADAVVAGSGITLLSIDVKAAHATYLTFAITDADGRDADLGNNDRSIMVPTPGRADADAGH
jgi:RNA polymerase sigma factor (sigma-70 family)